MGSIVACLMLVGVGLRAAGTVSGERERHTLDDLLATPLSVTSVLRAKWLAAIFVSRWFWIWLGLIWASAVAMRGLSPWALPWLLGTWLLIAGFFASVGLWISTWAASTQRAIQWMLVAFGIVAVGQWLAWLIATPVAVKAGISDRALDAIMELQAIGLTPPLTFFLLAAPSTEVSLWPAADWFNFRHMAVQGWYFWALGSLMFWAMAVVSFRRSIDRPAVVGEYDLIGYCFGPSRDGQWPVWRRLAIPVAAIIAYLLLGVYWSFTTHGSQERLDEAIAEADRLDTCWRLEELEAKRHQLSEAENSAYQVPAMPIGWTRKWFPGTEWPSATDLDEKLTSIPPNRLPPADCLRTLALELGSIKTVVDQARLLTGYPKGRYPIEFAAEWTNGNGWWQRSIRITNVLCYDARARAYARDLDDAIDDCIAALHSGATLGDEPTYASQLSRGACQWFGFLAIQRTLAQGQASEPALKSLSDALNRELGASLYLQATRARRAEADHWLTHLSTHCQDRWPLSKSFSNFNLLNALSWSDRLIAFLGLSLTADRAAVLHNLTQVVEHAKLQPNQWLLGIESLERRVNEASALSRQFPVADIGRWKRLTGVFQHRLAQLRCMTALVAAERYRLAVGHWPATLGDLVPAYLATVPTDPFDGKPLRYSKVPDGVLVYAVGPDLKDNGGTFPVLVWKIGERGTDVGFKAWSPEFRHLPPEPVAEKARK
jgi:hypothetical protein